MVDSQSLFDIDYNSTFEKALTDVTKAQYITVDTEATGLKVKDGRSHCIGISIAGRINREVFSYYFPVAHTSGNISDNNKAKLFEELKSRTRRNPIIYHNAKYDLTSLQTAGLDLLNNFFYDTLLMARIVNENYPSYRLDWLAKNVLRREGKRKSQAWEHCFTLFGWEKSDHFPPAIMGDYATGDTELTLYLFEHLIGPFVREGFDG